MSRVAPLMFRNKTMISRRLAVAATLLLTVFTAACGDDSVGGPSPTPRPTLQKPPVAAPNMAGRGEIVSATPFPALITRTEAGLVIAASGAAGVFVPRYDVQAFVVRYRTPGLNGQMSEATGAVYLPVGASGQVPMVAYMHGTVTSRTNVPSNPAATEGRLFGTAYATDGAIVVLPDYLGLGGSTGVQLYLHQQTHASASIDLLRAARTLATQRGVTPNRTRLSLTGYSQGGAVALGLLRELEANYTTEFPVQAVAAMSGPYDVSGTVRMALLLNPPYPPAVGYTALLAGSMATVYNLGALDQFVIGDALAVTNAILNGSVTDAQLATLPRTPRDLLNTTFAAKIALDNSDLFWQALTDNDTYDWKPNAAVRLFYGGGDIDVPPQNALTAQGIMRARGATNVSAVNVGATLTHSTAVVPATIAGKRFLDSLRVNP